LFHAKTVANFASEGSESTVADREDAETLIFPDPPRRTGADVCLHKCSGAVTYTYDADGNQTASSAGAANTYNPLNQTASMTPKTGGTPLTMTYTGTDNTQRTAAGGTTFTNNALGVASSTTSGTTTYFTRSPWRRP
jgi:hypothetical protein